jgi:cytochrome c oxidase cbb3-type subunit 3
MMRSAYALGGKIADLRPPNLFPRTASLMALFSKGVLAVVCLFALRTAAQTKIVSNPAAGNPATIREGASLFRANCAPCHGLNAKGGVRGPDLTSNRWIHGSSASDIFHNISQGVPGTEMPGSAFEDSEIWALVAYLRSLTPTKQPSSGDPVKGKAIFFTGGGCSRCHMIRGRGGRLGPDLSRVGAARSFSSLVDSIRDPSKELSVGMSDPTNPLGFSLIYDTVTVVTASGQKITGVAKNEDTYSIQLLDINQDLQVFLKKDLRQVIHEHKSLMPAYPEQVLNSAELQDLVAYLQTMQGN